MQNQFFINSLKQIHACLSKSALMLATLLAILSLSACSDNDEPEVIPSPQTFDGSLLTTIPSMPSFEAVTSDVDAKITWIDSKQTQATLNLGAFTIDTGYEGRGYAIGAMEITGISCTKASNGTVTFAKEAFSCQAGEYETTGSIQGQYANGKLTFTMVYKPGSMPFDVQSVFTTK